MINKVQAITESEIPVFIIIFIRFICVCTKGSTHATHVCRLEDNLQLSLSIMWVPEIKFKSSGLWQEPLPTEPPHWSGICT